MERLLYRKEIIELYQKIESLNNIVKSNLNVHQFYVPANFREYHNIIKKFEFCTIRTDHELMTDDLPFYIFDNHKDDRDKLDSIWNEACEKRYKLIISNGIKYDNIQNYNMVVQFQKNGDFLFEVSDLKIPLRHMYRHPISLLSCHGNLKDPIHYWDVLNVKYGINKLRVRKDLITLFNYQLFDKWLEVTKYPIPVGIKNENIVFWQIK